MSLFKSYTLTVERVNPGSYVNGKFVAGAATTFDIKTSWQPATGRELEALPEGMRQSAIFKGYPGDEVKTADPETLQEEDVITGPDGGSYRVVFVGPWQNSLINHYKFMAVREKEGT